MRYLIDGYNLMYAGGLMGKPSVSRPGPDALRRARTRFLNELADALGPVDAHQTTVVFDASNAPETFAREMIHHGVSVVFAADDESADARIELLIAGHSTPKSLTVVSTDRRIRQAAERRRSRAVTSDDFWVGLDARREARAPRSRAAPEVRPERPTEVSPEESEFWSREFSGLDEEPETREALGHNHVPMLSDAEIAELEREIEEELGI